MSILARFLLLCVALLTFPAIAASPIQGGFIQVDGGLLSVNLENVSLNDVLRTVGERAGVRVNIQGNLGNVQPQMFWGTPLPEGIKRLVQNSNADLIMIFSRDMAGHIYLEEIRAYEGNRNNLTSLAAPPTSSTPVPPPLLVHLRHTTATHRLMRRTRNSEKRAL